MAIIEYLAPAKVLVCTKCFKIGHFRSNCKSELEYCRICGVGVKDIKKHFETCDKKQCCIRCKDPHDSNDVRCPDIKSYRAMLTKSLLSTAGTTAHQQNVRANHNYNDQDFPVLSVNPNKLPYRINNGINLTGKRIDEMYVKQQWIIGPVDREIVPFSAEMDHPDKIIYIQQKWKNIHTCIHIQIYIYIILCT